MKPSSKAKEKPREESGDGEPVARKGFLGFWDSFVHDGWNWVFSSSIAVVSALPYFIGLYISLDGTSLFPMALTAPLGGLIAGPQLVGLADTILRSLRHEDTFWWRTYRSSWKRNFRGALLPGLFFGTLLAIQVFTLRFAVDVEPSLSTIAWVGLSVLLVTAISTFLIPLLAAVELRLPNLFKSAVVLCFHKPLRTLTAAILQIAYWVALAAFFPKSLPVFIIFQFWFPMAISMAIIYPPLERAYDLEARIRDLHGE